VPVAVVGECSSDNGARSPAEPGEAWRRDAPQALCLLLQPGRGADRAGRAREQV